MKYVSTKKKVDVFVSNFWKESNNGEFKEKCWLRRANNKSRKKQSKTEQTQDLTH